MTRSTKLVIVLFGVGTILMSGCSWDAPNTLSGYSDSTTGSANAGQQPQVPESMKTGTVTGDPNDRLPFGGL
ncbi:MAG: hypothetical protein JO069_03220 [Verrucomicrobia bacterium]|nr:hypothetical protein [Verrucomicrobiota bacterium]